MLVQSTNEHGCKRRARAGHGRRRGGLPAPMASARLLLGRRFMALRRAPPLLLAGVLSCGGVAPTHSARTADRRGADAPSTPTKRKVAPVDPETFRVELERLIAEIEAVRSLRFVGMDDGPVPAFDIESVSGIRYDSSALVGRQPFVVAFFATWCEACGRKLRSLRHALNE